MVDIGDAPEYELVLDGLTYSFRIGYVHVDFPQSTIERGARFRCRIHKRWFSDKWVVSLPFDDYEFDTRIEADVFEQKVHACVKFGRTQFEKRFHANWAKALHTEFGDVTLSEVIRRIDERKRVTPWGMGAA